MKNEQCHCNEDKMIYRLIFIKKKQFFANVLNERSIPPKSTFIKLAETHETLLRNQTEKKSCVKWSMIKQFQPN